MRVASILSVLLLAAGTAMAQQRDDLAKLVPADAKVEKLAGGMKFTEGPVWVADPGAAGGGSVLLSDQPSDATMLWNEAAGLKVHRQPTDHPNGHTLDLDGYVLGCREYAQKIVRFDRKLEKTETVVDNFNGKHFNSPNDVVVKRDGTIWFTDPPYNMPKGFKPEIGGNYVFRFDPKTREVRPVVTDFHRPNGLCFSPDQKTLYVADSGKPHHIRQFAIADDGSVTGGELLCVIDKGVPDGIRCDERGNVWSSAGDGVQIFAPDGKRIGRIPVPESPANLCFGGPDGKTVFITARTSLYRIPVLVRDAAHVPGR